MKNEQTSHPVFSVICVAYNHAQYIGQCIDSIQQQDYSYWELLILDDGSNDGTTDRVKPYLTDSRIQYFYQENKGSGRLSENYNFLLSKARGTYVTILEGDDFAEAELLSSHLEAIHQHPGAILSFNRVWVHDPGHLWEAPKMLDFDKNPDIFFNHPVGSAYNRLFFYCFIPAQGTTVRKDILVQSGGFEKVEGLPTVDYPTWIKLASIGTFAFIPKTLAHWRRHENQTTKQRIVKLYRLMVPVFEQTYDKLSPELLSHVVVSKEQVMKFWSVNMIKTLIRGGKYQLQSKQWKEGRKLFIQSFNRWPKLLLFWRVQSLLGLLLSILHLPWIHWYQAVSAFQSKKKHSDS